MTSIAGNQTLGILAEQSTEPVKMLAGVLASQSDEAKRLHTALSHSPLLGEFESTLAISTLAQAVLGLAETQGGILERLEALEASEGRENGS
jgi:hypothetical protein